MTSYTLQVQPRRSYTIEYSNQRGPQGPAGADGDDATATTDASLLVSGTLSDARLSSNVALENAANVFSAKQSFSGTDHAGLCLQSLTTAQYNALTPANGDLFRDSTTDRIDARLARGTVELIDSAGGQVINGALGVTGNITLATGVVITSGAAGVGVLTINNDGNSRWVYNGAEFIVDGAIRPSTTNARTLGTSGQRWSTVFGVAGDFSGNLTASGTITYSSINFPELVTNGDFSVGTGWTLGTGWSISGGTAVATSVASFADIQQNLPAVNASQTYVITFTVSITSGTIAAYLGANGNGNSIISIISASGSYSFLYHKSPLDNTKTILFRGNPSFTGTIDNVSVKRAF
jgi:hypothetical protein